MVLTVQFCFLSCISLSICYGFLLTNRTSTSFIGPIGLTDGHYLILTDALSIQKQSLAQMETFVLQLQQELKTLQNANNILKHDNDALKIQNSNLSDQINSFQNDTNRQFNSLHSFTNSSSYRLDWLEQKYLEIQSPVNSSGNRLDALEQNYALVSKEIRVLNEINQPVALTARGAADVVYNSGNTMKFQSTITSIGISNIAKFKNTGHFTCEKSGIYLFSVYVAIQCGDHARNGDFELYKNSDLISRVLIVLDGISGTYYSGSGTVAVQINTGDVLYANAWRNKMKIAYVHSSFTVIKMH